MFGKELIIDLHECDKEVFNEVDIDQYLASLCVLIGMERVGQPNCWYYDGDKEHLKGISVTQFIKTSSITLHASDSLSQIYINIFSCKDFSVLKALEFTEKWFDGKAVNYTVVERV